MNSIFHARAGAQWTRSQSGFSLLLVLILLVVMSLLGIAILRSSAMQERMGGNLRDRSLAREGAEAAIKYVQDVVLATPVSGVQWHSKALKKQLTATDCSSKGICDVSNATAPMTAVWMDLPSGKYDSRLPAAPQYRIEYIGTAGDGKDMYACKRPPKNVNCQNPTFRVTVRSRSAGRAEVELQSMISNVSN